MLNFNKHDIKSMLNATEIDSDYILAEHLFLGKTGSRDMKVIDNAPSLDLALWTRGQFPGRPWPSDTIHELGKRKCCLESDDDYVVYG